MLTTRQNRRRQCQNAPGSKLSETRVARNPSSRSLETMLRGGGTRQESSNLAGEERDLNLNKRPRRRKRTAQQLVFISMRRTCMGQGSRLEPGGRRTSTLGSESSLSDPKLIAHEVGGDDGMSMSIKMDRRSSGESAAASGDEHDGLSMSCSSSAASPEHPLGAAAWRSDSPQIRWRRLGGGSAA